MRKYVLIAGVLVVVAGLGTALSAQSSRRAALEIKVAALEHERGESQTKIAALEHERNVLQERLRPLEERQQAVVRITKELVVDASTTQSYAFSASIVPGTLTGTWRASGKGWGGADDTINGLRLTDPKDSPIYVSERGSSGNFVAKVSAPGTYTFFFDNHGLFRNTPRRVFLDAEFRPD